MDQRQRLGASPTTEELEDLVIDLINEKTREKVEQLNELDGNVQVLIPLFVPLPDGSYVTAEEATGEQWKQSTDWFVHSMAEECAERLQAAIKLTVACSLYIEPRPRPMTKTAAPTAPSPH